MIRRALAVLALVAAMGVVQSTPTWADLEVCNHARTSIFVSVAHKHKEKGWVSIGWWEIKREACEKPIVGSVQGTAVYLHARHLRAGLGWWWWGSVGEKSSETLCTPDSVDHPFTIYMNEVRGGCKAAGYVERGFRPSGSGQSFDYTARFWSNNPMSPAEEREQKPKDHFWECNGCPEMVVVPPGELLMGSPENEPQRRNEEGPRHKVTFAKPFAVSKGAITQEQFEKFVTSTGHAVSDKCQTWKDGAWTLETGRSFRDPGFAQGPKYPAVCLSHEDAKAYLVWLSKQTSRTYRLLSEAEWEYVARAGTITPFWWGSSISPAQANYNGNLAYDGGAKGQFRQRTVPAYDNKPSPWNLFIGTGNAAEWVEDCWNASYQGAPSDGSAWTAGDCNRRVVRGGSWATDPALLRSAARIGVKSDVRSSDVGFRVMRPMSN